MVSPQPFLAVILFYICCFYQAAELLRPNGRSLTDLCPYCVAKLVSKDFFPHWNSWKTASSLFLSCLSVSRLWKSVYHTYSAEFQLVNTPSCSPCSPVLCCKLTVYFAVFFFSCCQTIECACNSDKSYQFPRQTVTPTLPYWDIIVSSSRSCLTKFACVWAIFHHPEAQFSPFTLKPRPAFPDSNYGEHFCKANFAALVWTEPDKPSIMFGLDGASHRF